MSNAFVTIKTVLRVQSMVWHFVRHPVLSNYTRYGKFWVPRSWGWQKIRSVYLSLSCVCDYSWATLQCSLVHGNRWSDMAGQLRFKMIYNGIAGWTPVPCDAVRRNTRAWKCRSVPAGRLLHLPTCKLRIPTARCSTLQCTSITWYYPVCAVHCATNHLFTPTSRVRTIKL